MAFLDLDLETDQRAWGFMLQEMAARGVLLRRRGLNFITYSHSEADIAQAVAAAREVFGELGDILHTPELAKRLRLVDVHESFRRY
jgi:glutamate-1-semialdehyde aminotransferase